MANLKNASIREMVIDKCLSDRKRKYSTKDIMEACNKALEFEGYGPVTSLNTIRGDMQAIENRWHAYGGEIVEERCGRNKYYYYKKEGFFNLPCRIDRRRTFETERNHSSTEQI